MNQAAVEIATILLRFEIERQQTAGQPSPAPAVDLAAVDVAEAQAAGQDQAAGQLVSEGAK